MYPLIKQAGENVVPNFGRFTPRQTVYRDDRMVLYRGFWRDHQHLVLLKVLSSFRSQSDVELLTREYEFARELSVRAVLKPLERTVYEGLPALVYEDFDGISLNSLLNSPMESVDFLRVGEQIAEALSEIHRENIIHKDIKPENILIHPTTGEVKITGFGIATQLPRERRPIQKSRIIEGSFPYMSPEQTGGMNRVIDNRSDLYSLGVVFFKMLTLRFPFDAQDPLEWVHCHVARPAPSPRTVIPHIPQPISDIVLKLLSKMAEDRYQTASGVKEDLNLCRTQLLLAGCIETFVLGTHDISDKLQIPQILYGREMELGVLKNAFHRVVNTNRAELTLVSGYSGIGKSALVQELLSSIVGVRGFFLSGKFDQYKRNIPYATLAQAFRSLISEFLGENEQTLSQWRNRLVAALEANARLITDLIPEVELILGPQPKVPTLGLLQDQERFQLVFTRFVGVFARAEHPLVLFLDDLQWTDQGSLQLLEHLITELSSVPFFIIGAYRDKEVVSPHPLLITIEKIRAARRLVDHIVLFPLSLPHLTHLVANTLRQLPEQVSDLAELLFEKTGGNPFFAIQFLTELQHDGLLFFDYVLSQWKWDLKRIRSKGYTDNVVDLMVARIGHLAPETQEILKLVASVGNSTDASLLARVSEQDEGAIHQSLFGALQEGLLLRTGNTYLFAHDRIQQAAYSFIPQEERPGYHLRIGRLMLKSISEADLNDRIFEIVNQFTPGHALLTLEERQHLSELSLIAGRKAKAAAAYIAAVNYFSMGMLLLQTDSWSSHYVLTFELHLERARAEFLIGNLELAKDLLAELRDRGQTKRHLADVACAEIVLCGVQGDNRKAVEIGLAFLRHFGIHWLPHPNWAEPQAEYEQLERNIGTRTIEELIDLPLMTDPDAIIIMEVLIALYTTVLTTSGNLLCLLICRVANLMVLFGNVNNSGYGYVLLGMVLVHFFGRYREAYRFAKLGCSLTGRNGLSVYQARAQINFSLVSAWTQPLDLNHDILQRARQIALQTGDLTYVCYYYNNLVTFHIVRGAPLSEVYRISEEGLAFVRKVKLRLVELIITSQQRLIMNLQGRTDHFSTFNDENFNEEHYEAHFEMNRASLAISICWYYIWKLMARFLSNNYDEALKAAQKAKELLWASPSFVEVPEYHYFHGLTRAALFNQATSVEREVHLNALREECEHFRAWSEYSPENFQYKYALLAAEIARIEGNHPEAEHLYEQAISRAREQGLTQNEALGFDLAARYYLGRGFTRIGEVYLRDARACYARWGADGKVKQLERIYPQLAEHPEAERTGTFATRPEHLDLLSVIKASQSISGEIELKNLICRLVQVVIEKSGAQRGYLFLIHDGKPRIEAEALSTEIGIEMRIASVTPLDSSLVSESIIQFVLRAREKVILGDARTPAGRGKFQSDRYLLKAQPKSVLCLPITRGTRVVGLLYLENNLMTHAFTSEHVTVLDLLASQAAISLEVAFSIQQEQQARSVAEKALQIRDEFMMIAAHELKTPLTPLKMQLHLLKGLIAKVPTFDPSLGTSTVQKSLLNLFKSSDQQVDRLSKLVEDLLDVSRISTGHLRLNVEVIDLSKLVCEVVERYQTQWSQANCKVELEVKEKVSGRWDYLRIEQVVVNLLTNAIKYGAGMPIKVKVEVKNHHAKLTVQDFGIGIDEKDQARIFGRYERAISVRHFGGFGLGLYISQQIVQAHGGRILLESKLGIGSTFIVELPLNLVDAE